MKKITFLIFLFSILILCACTSETHDHTFSDEFSYDENYHWHASTCSHDVTSDKELHQFDDGVLKDKVITYTCKVCGYTKTESSETHDHTFSDQYSYDENYHWHASTCSHDVTSDKELHQFDDGELKDEVITYTCKICGYTKTTNSEETVDDNIRLAEEIIINVYNACVRENTDKKAKKRKTSSSSLVEVLQEESGLTGSLYYDVRNVEGFYQASSGTLACAFGLLEFFVQNGLSENDFSNKLYFNPYIPIGSNELNYVKINLISDKVLAIDFGHEHMILGEDGDITFALYYGYSTDLSSDYMEYLNFSYYSNNISLYYQDASLNWKDEIDLAINYLKDAEDFSVLPLETLKKIYLVDGVENPITHHYDKNNQNHIVLPTYNRLSFTAPESLQEYFLHVHCLDRLSIPQMNPIIEDGVLKYFDNCGLKMIEIPEDVKKIEGLEYRLEDIPYGIYYYALFFHNTDIEFAEQAFDMVSGIDSIFIDVIEKNEEFENQIKEHFPNVKFYYQDQWEIKCDLVLPKVTLEEDDSDHQHVFTRQIQSDEYLAQEANCLHAKCYYYVCELCDKHGNLFYEVGEKGDHNYVENDRFGDEVFYICTICELQYSHNEKDTEHHFVLIEEVPATCTEDGYALYRCKITGEEKIVTQAKFHHCFVNGSKCIKCNAEMITYEEHDFRYDGVEEIIDDLFIIRMYCVICGDEYLQYSNFEGHRFENGVCKDCHLEEHDHKYGKEFSVKDIYYHCCNICGYIEKIDNDE